MCILDFRTVIWHIYYILQKLLAHYISYFCSKINNHLANIKEGHNM